MSQKRWPYTICNTVDTFILSRRFGPDGFWPDNHPNTCTPNANTALVFVFTMIGAITWSSFYKVTVSPCSTGCRQGSQSNVPWGGPGEREQFIAAQ